MRQERSKYLSLIGSLIGAALGIIGTSVNHALKNRDFKKILHAIELQNSLQEDLFNELQRRDLQEEQVSVKEAVEDREGEQQTLLQRMQHQAKVQAMCTAAVTCIVMLVTLPLVLRFCGN